MCAVTHKQALTFEDLVDREVKRTGKARHQVIHHLVTVEKVTPESMPA